MVTEHLCMGCMKDKGEQDTCPHCGWEESTMPESPQHLPPRTLLNEKYLIGRVLGQGGFGITYLGWDINLNIKLAVKEFMPQELASRAAGHSMVSAYTGALHDQFEYGLEKFLQEARTLAQFEGHPSIVSVRDFFRSNGTAYLVMHYIEGVTLKEYVAQEENILPFNKTLQIMMPVMDALKEVHAVNILHRDISPDNIFINLKGQVILIDFGAARQAIGEKGRSLSIIMKPGYTPEEQYRSKGVQGPWTDIYAVAATMYRVITGQMPPESLDRLEEDTLVPPSQLGIDIGEIEEQALLTALAVRAGDRYQSMEEFQEGILGGVIYPEQAGPYIAPDHSAPALPATYPGTQQSYTPVTERSQTQGVAAPKDMTADQPFRQRKPAVYYAAAAGVLLVAIVIYTAISYFGEKAPIPPPSAGINGANDLPESTKGAEIIAGENIETTSGTFAYESGTYTGEHYGEKPHGEGTWVGNDGREYVGQWHNGLAHGEGIWSSPDGALYDGEWKEGKRNGYGVYVSANRSQYVGEWEDDKRSGRGTEKWPNGSEYVGEWRNNLRHGQGTYTWPNGAQYVGEWKEGFQHGQGTFTDIDGRVQSGTWVYNEFQR